MREEITQRQRKVLRDFTEAFSELTEEGNGYIVYPTLKQVATLLEMGAPNLYKYVAFFVRVGLLEKDGCKYRPKGESDE